MEIKIPLYNDIWMDNAVENLYALLKDFDDEIGMDINKETLMINYESKGELNDLLVNLVESNLFNLIVIEKDRKTGEKKEVKKDFILIQEGKKIDGKVAFKENIYKEPKKATSEILDLIEKDGKKTCVMCGKTFSKPYKKLQQATYPFVTKIKSLGGVRTYKDGEFHAFREYHDNFCPKCYLIGILEWLDTRIIYRTFIKEKKSVIFLPYFDNLKDLIEFKGEYAPLLNKSERYSNIRVNINENKTERTPEKFSTLLCFYEKFLMDIESENVVGKDWAIMEIPLGSVKNIKLRILNLTDSTLSVIKEMSEEDIRIYGELINQIQFYLNNPKGSSVDFETTNKIREKLSKSILVDDFRNFAKTLVPRKGGNVGFLKENHAESRQNLETLIYVWRLKKMGISKENLGSIKSVGNIIAKVSKNNLSLLYKLDKTRNIGEFWGVLREISRKLIGLDLKKAKVRPMALDELIHILKDNEKQWEEIRDLLVVYSSMYYAIGSRGGEKE
ncbi:MULTISPECIES: hypothetical protein [Methanobacterium]|uniref:Type I-B CRISPR-associated protein Cas8b1/Cst1 n=1 Tax=Methanobacterium bryantii TaxID=2161 RepID=A0A2A2H6B8_METBR|nr:MULTISPECIES: hypothetical protein [Methanobacterium]OEC88793.1 hypothetical protein A9507_03685 [Methanobacterium sp. A39]PAV04803.1 hypothetical protein ASJ80_10850 [Methanobacterium bryantii]